MAKLPAHLPSLAGGEAIASPYRVGLVRAVEGTAGEGSGASVDWLLTAIADEDRRAECSVRRAGASPWVGQLRAVDDTAGKLLMRTRPSMTRVSSSPSRCDHGRPCSMRSSSMVGRPALGPSGQVLLQGYGKCKLSLAVTVVGGESICFPLDDAH